MAMSSSPKVCKLTDNRVIRSNLIFWNLSQYVMEKISKYYLLETRYEIKGKNVLTKM